MSMVSRIKDILVKVREVGYQKRHAAYDRELSLTDAFAAFPDPNKLYAYMHHCFRFRCPQYVRDHRDYFKRDQRGFGEDAFHAMWWLLLKEFKPSLMLEIGVYRGQTISLWALICHYEEHAAEVHGISPFRGLGDSTSSYLDNLDYINDTLGTFRQWSVPAPVLVKALSTDPEAIAHVQRFTWDVIYIDGSHDFDIALSDYRLCRPQLRKGGILILDDASVGTAYRPPSFAFAGHLGPSRVAREWADNQMRFLGAVGHNNIFIRP